MKLEQIKLINGIHEWLWNRINAHSTFIESVMCTSENDIVNWNSLSTIVENYVDSPFVVESPSRSYKVFANVSLIKEGAPRFTFKIVKYYKRTMEPTEFWMFHQESWCIQLVDNNNVCNTLDIVIFNMSNDGTLNIEKCDENEAHYQGDKDKLDAFIDTLIKSIKRLFEDDKYVTVEKAETSQCIGIRTIPTFDIQTYPVGSFIEVTLDHGPLCYCNSVIHKDDDVTNDHTENGDGVYWSIGHTYRCIIANYLNCGTHMVTQATSNVFGVREIGIDAQDVADGKIKINLIL